MPLSWNEIRTRAVAFSKDWAGESSEHAEAKTFWDQFFHIFGVSRRRIASFEQHVKKIDGKDGFIDLLWKGVLLIEHKSLGKNLDRAHKQALDYFPGLKERDLPRYLMVSDFAKFRLYDLDEDSYNEFSLEELHKNINLFGFIAGYQTHVIKDQDPVNIKAAECMGRLHDQMKAVGYEGHPLEVYLVRLLFCMFGEDTGIFERQQFQDYIEDRTSEDGSDLAHHLGTMFHVLNTPDDKRLKNLDEQLADFPYVNGKLFEENLPPAGFDSGMRQALLDCCALDWSRISPAIFGSLFQSIMDKQARRNLGAHYTSEKNILKLINPLFMDELREEFEKSKTNKNKLFEFHKKLRSLTFLDPACGCGNFLVIAYRELRLLELDVLRASNKSGQMTIDVHHMIQLDVDQFYGIEIEEFPAQIAQVALWLMDHQMNLLVSEEFGMYFARIPLKSIAQIVHGNALRIDWNDVIQPEKLSFIMGNPPFLGKTYQSKEQKTDLLSVSKNIKNASDLDFVAGWYIKAADIMNGTNIRCAFVSTNSITQGEQVSILWGWLLANNIEIFFAHRTFQWNNEAKGNAAVHCVIIGFAAYSIKPKLLFEYESIKGKPLMLIANNINPYLVDAKSILLEKNRAPISNAPLIRYGNKPTDNGFYLFTAEEKTTFIINEPQSEVYFRKYIGAKEFINSIPRYCLWLHNAPPQDLKKCPEVLKRIESVKEFRLASTARPTQMSANTPQDFFYISHSDSDYLVIPETSSERRRFIPIGYMDRNVIASNALWTIPNASKFDFAILTSTMHMSWVRSICGRLKSDYRYTGSIIYNNFPWPLNPTEKQKQSIEDKAQAVLDARKQFPDATLADLYDPLTMPPVLLKAHQALDKAVDAAYSKKSFKTEAERVAFLFDLYQQYTSLLPKDEKKPKKKK
jgi:hypothetical protein